MNEATRTAFGRVGTSDALNFVRVAPEDGGDLLLEAWQIRSAKRGDRVKLDYRIGATGGYWIVAEILTP